MSTSRYLQQAAAGASGGSMVPTGPIVGLECVCNLCCIFNCNCCACVHDMQAYAYGDKGWLGITTSWYNGSAYTGRISIMHYDDESCWNNKTWNTAGQYSQGLSGCGMYIHPISGAMFALGQAGAYSGIAYISGNDPNASTSPSSWGIYRNIGTTAAGGLTAVSAVGDCKIHQSSYYGGTNLWDGGVVFCCNYVPGVMGGYCDANCCFFYAFQQMRCRMQIPRLCNGTGAPTDEADTFISITSTSCCWNPRGSAMQYFVDENDVVHATGMVCKCNGCYAVRSSNGMNSWGVFSSFCNTPVSNFAYTGIEYVYSCNNVLKAGSCCLCYPGTSDLVTANSGHIRSTVLRDEVYITICQTLYKGIQG